MGPLEQAGGEPIGAANKKASRWTVFGPPFVQQAGKRRTVEIFAALMETDQDRALRNDGGDRDRFLDPTPLHVLGAALANSHDLKIAKAQCAAGDFRALAVRRGEFPLRALF